MLIGGVFSAEMSTESPSSGQCVWEGEVFGEDPCRRLSMAECLTGGKMGSCVWSPGSLEEVVTERMFYRVPSWEEIGSRWEVDLYLVAVVSLVVMALAIWRCLSKRHRKDRIATARAQSQTEMPPTAGLYYQQL